MYPNFLSRLCNLSLGTRRIRSFALYLLLGTAIVAGHDAVAAYPDKPIKLILMFPPGGGSDGQSRLIAEVLNKSHGQITLIDNRPGAGGIIAATAVKGAPADGYTLLHAGVALMTLTPRFNSAATYSESDFVPIASIATAPPMLFARADFPANDLKQLRSLAQAKPGQLSYGTWGPGSVPEVAGEWLMSETGMKLFSVPYRGEVPLVQDVLGKQLPLGWATLPVLLQHLKAGTIKVLAVAAEKRDPSLPQVPTFIEQGVPDFVISGWTGIFAPKGTPATVVKLINERVNEVLNTPEVRTRIADQGQSVLILDSVKFGEFIKKDAERLRPVLDKLAPGIKR